MVSAPRMVGVYDTADQEWSVFVGYSCDKSG